MNNNQIAATFHLLAQIMELYDENTFKIRSYDNAYRTLRKVEQPLSKMTNEELQNIKGIGNAIAAKIGELLETGRMKLLEEYKQKTPTEVISMLQINGLGPKKVRAIWQELGIETIGELEYACQENRLKLLKGFGDKIQQDVLKNIHFYYTAQGNFLYAEAEKVLDTILHQFKQKNQHILIEPIKEMRLKKPIVQHISLLVGVEESGMKNIEKTLTEIINKAENILSIPIDYQIVTKDKFYFLLFLNTNGNLLLQPENAHLSSEHFNSETSVFEAMNLPYLIPEMREPEHIQKYKILTATDPKSIIQSEQVKGILHCHTTYSDGLHSLREMAEFVKQKRYEYIGITDHSQAAVYANGLSIERVQMQWKEIEQLNKELAPFKIFKGIESDILADGSLDYPNEILSQFDFIIASIHAHLKMDIDKATQRLIRAIENPFTTILGHPTGRLLLGRLGYPIHHQKVIDACADNHVAIELNANPKRLDLDWTWIDYCIKKDVTIAINSDAHSREGINVLQYGINVARKAGLPTYQNLTSKTLSAFEKYLNDKSNISKK